MLWSVFPLRGSIFDFSHPTPALLSSCFPPQPGCTVRLAAAGVYSENALVGLGSKSRGDAQQGVLYRPHCRLNVFLSLLLRHMQILATFLIWAHPNDPSPPFARQLPGIDLGSPVVQSPARVNRTRGIFTVACRELPV